MKTVYPDGDAKVPGVVLIHEWWGVNEQIQTQGRKWADAGFACVIPDLYGGKVAKTADEAGAMMKALDFGKAVKQIGEAVAQLKDDFKTTQAVAVTGYCMGGALTLASAVNLRGLSCAVSYYGWPGDLDWTKIDAPIQAHFAKHDDWAKVELVEKAKAAARVPFELHVYDAQHAFCNDRRPEVYDAKACALAWERTVAFVKQHTA
ncbi:MAG: dienelactone hydrolase family protein [Myxococcales bacterium]|nr:dienelactone hydrolase family protein [Myxococcales bacterium]